MPRSMTRPGFKPSFLARRDASKTATRKPIPIMRPYILIGIGPRDQLPILIPGISKRTGCTGLLFHRAGFR